jgi:muramoyltetrapeptide carboxypeptidase
MLLPPFLKPHDTVAIAATARKVSPEEMQYAITLLEQWQLKVVIDEQLYAKEHQFAGNDNTRTQVFQKLLDDKNIRAIFCARGGYGTVRMVDGLSFHTYSKHPKWIIGYSDITVLHSHIQKHYATATIHGPMPISMLPQNAHEESLNQLKNILFGEQITYVTEPHALNRIGITKGMLTGGNLSVLYSLSASISDVSTDDKILFLEDLDEYLYHIDRMMMQLKRSGKLSKLRALIVGSMSDMKDNTIPFGKTAYEIIQSHVEEYTYPVCYGFPAGHDKKNLPLMMGAECQLEVTPNSTVLNFLNDSV